MSMAFGISTLSPISVVSCGNKDDRNNQFEVANSGLFKVRWNSEIDEALYPIQKSGIKNATYGIEKSISISMNIMRKQTNSSSSPVNYAFVYIDDFYDKFGKKENDIITDKVGTDDWTSYLKYLDQKATEYVNEKNNYNNDDDYSYSKGDLNIDVSAYEYINFDWGELKFEFSYDDLYSNSATIEQQNVMLDYYNYNSYEELYESINALKFWDNDNIIAKLKTNGDSVFLMSTTSSENGWTYKCVIPDNPNKSDDDDKEL